MSPGLYNPAQDIRKKLDDAALLMEHLQKICQADEALVRGVMDELFQIFLEIRELALGLRSRRLGALVQRVLSVVQASNVGTGSQEELLGRLDFSIALLGAELRQVEARRLGWTGFRRSRMRMAAHV